MKVRGSFAIAACVLAITTRAAADDVPSKTQAARTAYLAGTKLVEQAHWGEALDAFEHAAELVPHAVTTFNIAACERAMGRYTRARKRFAAALAQNDAANGTELSLTLGEQARTYLREIDQLLVHLELNVEPGSAGLAIDGRPLEAAGAEDGTPLFVAGVLPAGDGQGALGPSVHVLIDPGPHVLRFSRPGFTSEIVRKTFAPGTSPAVRVMLAELPATLRITTNRKDAIVTVDETDVGPAPVELSRSAGTHSVVVKSHGFVPYTTRLTVVAGQEADIQAPLTAEKPSIFSRWWFWTIAGVAVAGVATGTYFLTRPDPQRDAVPRGSLGFAVSVP